MPALVLWVLGCRGVDRAAAPLRRARVRALRPRRAAPPRCSTGSPSSTRRRRWRCSSLPLVFAFSYPWAFAVVVGMALVVLVTERYEGSGLARLGLPSGGTAHHLPGARGRHGRRRPLRHLRRLCRLHVGASCSARSRWSAAWTWSASGFAVKLFPAALWPVFLIAEWRRTGRVPCAAGCGGWRARCSWWPACRPSSISDAVLNVLHYYLHRPTEDGSLPAGLSVLLDSARRQLGRDLPQRQRRERLHRRPVGRHRAVPASGRACGCGGSRPGTACPSRRPAWPRSRS